MNELLTPGFIIGYTILIAMIAGLFVFRTKDSIVTPIIELLSEILKGVVTGFNPKAKEKKSRKKNK